MEGINGWIGIAVNENTCALNETRGYFFTASSWKLIWHSVRNAITRTSPVKLLWIRNPRLRYIQILCLLAKFSGGRGGGGRGLDSLTLNQPTMLMEQYYCTLEHELNMKFAFVLKYIISSFGLSNTILKYVTFPK